MISLIPQSSYDPLLLQPHLPSYLHSYLSTLPNPPSLQPVPLKLLTLTLLQCYKITKSLKLPSSSLRIYTTILFSTIIHNNILIQPSQQHISRKNKQDDWQFLEERVREYPGIEEGKLCRMLEEFKRYYFDNFQVFKVAFEEGGKGEGKKIYLVVDKPQIMPRLGEAVEKKLQVIMVDDEEEES